MALGTLATVGAALAGASAAGKAVTGASQTAKGKKGREGGKETNGVGVKGK